MSRIDLIEPATRKHERVHRRRRQIDQDRGISFVLGSLGD
jgi:hypothetical protein